MMGHLMSSQLNSASYAQRELELQDKKKKQKKLNTK